ncbi:MAG: PGPGW domain-containing protein [Actinomycetota bacterium]|nr:PGPGW domain-containing protein [Actinomycetota bacterium]
MAEDEHTKPSLVERLEQQRDRHRGRPLIVRVLYVVAGFTVLGAGLAMLLLPGPAFIAIPIGLALLSLEFAWAEGLLGRALQQGEIAKRKAVEATKIQRILSVIALALGAGAVVAWALLGDIPLVPV